MSEGFLEAQIAVHTLTAKLTPLTHIAEYGELMGAANAVQDKLASALAQNIKILGENKDLILKNEAISRELNSINDWSLKASEYDLERIGGGVFAQVYNKKDGSLKPYHWVCVNCFEKRNISILQKIGSGIIKCNQCDWKTNELYIDHPKKKEFLGDPYIPQPKKRNVFISSF